VIGGPKTSMIIPNDYDWHLLAGDLTALPAIRRRLEELPPGVRAIVLVQSQEDADRLPVRAAAALDLRWVGAGENLADRLASLDWPPSEGFAWCAGEAHAMAEVREALTVKRGLPHQAMRVASYWNRDD
jgi:NADPH-dependent ferric siderophore reductase